MTEESDSFCEVVNGSDENSPPASPTANGYSQMPESVSLLTQYAEAPPLTQRTRSEEEEEEANRAKAQGTNHPTGNINELKDDSDVEIVVYNQADGKVSIGKPVPWNPHPSNGSKRRSNGNHGKQQATAAKSNSRHHRKHKVSWLKRVGLVQSNKFNRVEVVIAHHLQHSKFAKKGDNTSVGLEVSWFKDLAHKLSNTINEIRASSGRQKRQKRQQQRLKIARANDVTPATLNFDREILPSFDRETPSMDKKKKSDNIGKAQAKAENAILECECEDSEKENLAYAFVVYKDFSSSSPIGFSIESSPKFRESEKIFEAEKDFLDIVNCDIGNARYDYTRPFFMRSKNTLVIPSRNEACSRVCLSIIPKECIDSIYNIQFHCPAEVEYIDYGTLSFSTQERSYETNFQGLPTEKVCITYLGNSFFKASPIQLKVQERRPI